MTRNEAIERLVGVEEEFLVTYRALERYRHDLLDEARGVQRESFTVQSVRRCSENVENVYLVRLWAEFEAILREYLRSRRHAVQMPRTPTEVLVESVGARQNIEPGALRDVHDVRILRNNLVHRGEGMARVPLDQARRRLALFLSRLPLEW